MSIDLEMGNKCLSALETLHTSWQDTFLIKCIRKNILPRLSTALQPFNVNTILRQNTCFDKAPYTSSHISGELLLFDITAKLELSIIHHIYSSVYKT